jgi:hypothetical protein
MPAPYSYDLWLKREKETGDYEAIANKQGRHSNPHSAAPQMKHERNMDNEHQHLLKVANDPE